MPSVGCSNGRSQHVFRNLELETKQNHLGVKKVNGFSVLRFIYKAKQLLQLRLLLEATELFKNDVYS